MELKMKRATPSRGLVIKINLFFLAFLLLLCAFLLLKPSSSYYENSASLVRSSLHKWHHNKIDEYGGLKRKAIFEEKMGAKMIRRMPKREIPSFLNENNIVGNKRIGFVNMENEDVSNWKVMGGGRHEIKHITFEKVSKNLEWKDLFPEWIDEEEENDVPLCPEIPIPKFERYGEVDMVVAKIPCRYPEEGWRRDVFRLQVHQIVAKLLVKNGKRKGNKSKLVILSECSPMLEIFRCDDMVNKEGKWWLFEVNMDKLEKKVSMPIGSCLLALPLWGEEGTNDVYNLSTIKTIVKKPKKEAYVTVLHSSETYVCGAITLAQSILKTGTKRDLVMLLDSSVSQQKRDALASSGWNIRIITRIRNPRAKNNSYNEYNYSKFRLWQLTDYDKVIFIDSDIIVLRNLEILFHFPQMSATGNDGSIFNSGIMVIEPSNCTFNILMEQRENIVSYNGGDQGFLNEIFVWWHRLPRRVNFLKNFWANTTLEASIKNQLFGSNPPKLYSIHYLGIKPWLCYRDYDCNWNKVDQQVYASDIAHRSWWKIHDEMDEKLQRFCKLTPRRRFELDWDAKKAGQMGLPNEHWKINITDPRRHV